MNDKYKMFNEWVEHELPNKGYEGAQNTARFFIQEFEKDYLKSIRKKEVKEIISECVTDVLEDAHKLDVPDSWVIKDITGGILEKLDEGGYLL